MALSNGERQSPRKLDLIAGFWQRLPAFVLDAGVIGVPTLLVGLVFFQTAFRLGEAGRVFGFVVALLYFGLLDSRLGGGQTLGKRLLGIRVIDRQGRLLSPLRSVARFLIIAIPYFLLRLWLAPAVSVTLLEATGFFAYGALGAALYLFFFNLGTGQSLHDLAVRSFVVQDPPMPVPSSVVTAPVHLVVACFCFVPLAIFVLDAIIWQTPRALPSADAMKKLAQATGRQDAYDLEETVTRQLGIPSVAVGTGKTTITWAGSAPLTTTTLYVTTRPDIWVEDPERLVPAIAAVILERRPDLLGQQELSVEIDRYFDLGIAWWTDRRRESRDTAAWREKLGTLAENEDAPAGIGGTPTDTAGGPAKDAPRRRCTDPIPRLTLERCTILIESGRETPADLAVDFFERGNAHAGAEDYARAIADYDQALRRNPDDVRALCNMGTAYTFERDFDHAFEAYDHAIRLDPADATTLFDRGQAYLRKGDYDRAAADFGAAIRLKPDELLAFINRGAAYLELRDYAASLADFEAALKLSRRASAFYGRGLARQGLGDSDGASDDLATARQLDPLVAKQFESLGLTPSP
jgi:Tfp pilus assembly protein PilF/uncharacterized RDD family membrane protein YckC